MTDSDQAVPEIPGYDPKNFSEGATSYVIKAAAAEDGEREGKTKPLEDPGAEVEESEPESGPCKESVTPSPKIDNKCKGKDSEPVAEDEESEEKSPDDAKGAFKSDNKKNLGGAKEKGAKSPGASKKGDSNSTNDKKDEGNARDSSPEPEGKEDVKKTRTGTPRRSPRLKRKNREDGIDDIAIQSSLSSTSKKARQKMEERTSFAKTKIKNKRKLGVSDGDGVRRKAAKKTPEDDESAAAAKDWMTDDEAGDEDSDDGKEEDQTDTVDWGHVESPLRLPKVSEIASTPPRSPQSKTEESGASATTSSSTPRPLVSSLASPSIDQKRVVEIVDAAAYAADKERRADRARKLLEAFDDE